MDDIPAKKKMWSKIKWAAGTRSAETSATWWIRCSRLKHVDFKISTTRSDATNYINRWKKLDASARKYRESLQNLSVGHVVTIFLYRPNVFSWSIKNKLWPGRIVVTMSPTDFPAALSELTRLCTFAHGQHGRHWGLNTSDLYKAFQSNKGD